MLKRTKLHRLSRKRAKEIAIYSKLKKELNYTICVKCGKRVSDYKLLDLHHLEHRGMGGKDTQENLVALCRACHISVHQELEG